jgi:protein YIPF1/2
LSKFPFLTCSQAEAKATRLFIVVIAALHAGLALTFKIMFFNYYAIAKIGADLPIPGVDDPATNTTTTAATLMHRAFTALF